jgi:hypothetical protein
MITFLENQSWENMFFCHFESGSPIFLCTNISKTVTLVSSKRFIQIFVSTEVLQCPKNRRRTTTPVSGGHHWGDAGLGLYARRPHLQRPCRHHGSEARGELGSQLDQRRTILNFAPKSKSDPQGRSCPQGWTLSPKDEVIPWGEILCLALLFFYTVEC